MRLVFKLLLTIVLSAFPVFANEIDFTITNKECIDGPSEKVIDGFRVFRDCWRWKYNKNYNITQTTESCNNIDHDSCYIEGSASVDQVMEGYDQFHLRTKKVYNCFTKHVYEVDQRTLVTNKTSGENLLCDLVCIDGKCPEVFKEKEEENDELKFALTQLQMLRDIRNGASGDINLTQNFTFMQGQLKSCDIWGANASDCCRDSGILNSAGLVKCKPEEIDLANDQKRGSCVGVGNRCEEKILGICVKKSRRYCCFEGVLPKIIQKQGREQLNKSWGSGKNPNCTGFTLNELEKLDFSNMNFDEFYEKVLLPKLGSVKGKTPFDKLETNRDNSASDISPDYGINHKALKIEEIEEEKSNTRNSIQLEEGI